jgi:hypothetical protein
MSDSKPASLRDQMPVCAEFLDGLREAFGTDEMNHVVRRGLSPSCPPELTVFFSEGGHTLGKRYVPDPAKTVGGEQLVVRRPGDEVVPKKGRT